MVFDECCNQPVSVLCFNFSFDQGCVSSFDKGVSKAKFIQCLCEAQKLKLIQLKVLRTLLMNKTI